MDCPVRKLLNYQRDPWCLGYSNFLSSTSSQNIIPYIPQNIPHTASSSQPKATYLSYLYNIYNIYTYNSTIYINSNSSTISQKKSRVNHPRNIFTSSFCTSRGGASRFGRALARGLPRLVPHLAADFPRGTGGFHRGKTKI